MPTPAQFGEEHNLPAKARGDEGFMLLAALVMVFLVLLTLSVAAPRIAKQIQRDRELESQHRADQYVRAIRIFYIKFKRYPTSIEQLESTNNQRFLRQRYIDPLTGKDDWRLIHVGENQTTVKGFFGDDLPGLPTGLGSAAGLASSTGTSAFSNGSATSPGNGSSGGAAGTGSAFSGTSTPGAAGASAFGQAGTAGGGTNGSTSGTGGIASQSATSFTGSGGGPIIGVGSNKSGEAMLVVDEQTTYETWEFLYDPRIEQLYAKSTLLGGISSGSGAAPSTSGTGTSNGFGNPSTLGFGGSTTPTTGSPSAPTGTGATGGP